MHWQLWDILQKTVTRWSRNDGNLLAASMAYYAAFSFFPLLLVLISAIGFALRFSANAQDAQEQLVEFLSHSFSPSLAAEVQEVLERVMSGVKTSALFNTPIGLFTLFLGAIGIFSQLEAAFDRLWHAVTPHDRGVRAAIYNALWNRLKAFLTLISLGIVMLVAFVAELLLAGLRSWGEGEKFVWTTSLMSWLQMGFSVVLNAIVLMFVFRMIPRAQVRWLHALIGGVAVAILWQIGSQIVSRVIVGTHYTAYGVVGSFMAMMLWVYCGSILLFLGGQLVQVLGHPDENSIADPPPVAAPTAKGKRASAGGPPAA